MAFKIAVVVLICVGFVRTDIGTITVLNSAPEAESNTLPILEKQIEVNDPYPQYHYSYNVQDTLSGDSKSQFETRDGDVINGEYSLNDADGYRRTVKYTADSIHGFNAVVQRLPINQETKTTPLNASPAAPFNTFPAEVVSTSLTGTTSPTIATTVLTPLTAQLPSNIVKPAQNSYAAPLALTSHQPYTQPTSVQSLNNFNFPHGLTSYTRPLPFGVPPTYVSSPDFKINEPTFSYTSPKFVPPFNAYTYTSVPQEHTYDVPNTHIENNNYGSPATYSYPYQISSGYSHSHAPNAPTLSPRQNIYSYKAPFFYNNYPSPYY